MTLGSQKISQRSGRSYNYKKSKEKLEVESGHILLCPSVIPFEASMKKL
jgi:hypothetical protein